MHTTKKTMVHLDPGDNMQIDAGNIVINVWMYENGKPAVQIECSRGLSVHHCNKSTGVRQTAHNIEPHLAFVAHEQS